VALDTVSTMFVNLLASLAKLLDPILTPAIVLLGVSVHQHIAIQITPANPAVFKPKR
jgi:hypothetical protein